MSTAGILATGPASYLIGKQYGAIKSEKRGLQNARRVAASARKTIKDMPADLLSPKELEVYTERRKTYINDALKSRKRITALKRGMRPRIAAVGLTVGGALGGAYLSSRAKNELISSVKTASQKTQSPVERVFAPRDTFDYATAFASGLGATVGANNLQNVIVDKMNARKLTRDLTSKVNTKLPEKLLKRQRNARALIAGSILAGTAIPAARHLYQDYKAKTASDLTAQLHAYKEKLHN